LRSARKTKRATPPFLKDAFAVKWETSNRGGVRARSFPSLDRVPNVANVFEPEIKYHPKNPERAFSTPFPFFQL